MQSTSEKLLASRLKGSLTSTYQTMLGITQGGALGYLVLTSFGELGHFDPVQWWLVGLTFGVLILVWYTITMDTISWNWAPSLLDSFIPFFIGAYELVFIYMITLVPSLGLRPWLVGMAVGAVFQYIGFWHTTQHANKEPENQKLLQDLQRDIQRRHRYSMVTLILFPLVALVSFGLPVGNLESSNMLWVVGIMVTVTILHIGCFFYVNRFFQAVVARTRTQDKTVN